MEQSKYFTWLKKNRDLFNIAKIETDLGMGDGTLRKALKDQRALPENWHKPIEKYLQKLAKKIDAIERQD